MQQWYTGVSSRYFKDILRLDDSFPKRKLSLRGVIISAFATADHKKRATCSKPNGAEEAQEHFGESREKRTASSRSSRFLMSSMPRTRKRTSSYLRELPYRWHSSSSSCNGARSPHPSHTTPCRYRISVNPPFRPSGTTVGRLGTAHP